MERHSCCSLGWLIIIESDIMYTLYIEIYCFKCKLNGIFIDCKRECIGKCFGSCSSKVADSKPDFFWYDKQTGSHSGR